MLSLLVIVFVSSPLVVLCVSSAPLVVLYLSLIAVSGWSTLDVSSVVFGRPALSKLVFLVLTVDPNFSSTVSAWSHMLYWMVVSGKLGVSFGLRDWLR